MVEHARIGEGGYAHQPRCLLVTGGAGFIGCNFVRYLLASDPTLVVVTLDALTYAGSRRNLSDVEATHGARHHFVPGDIGDADLLAEIFAGYAPDTVVHLAAESHVDRSIDDPLAVVRTNLLGTATLLEATRRAWYGRQDVRFHHVGTDEVYGSLGMNGQFREGDAYDPSSPYSASKAGSDHLVRAWARTYGLPVTLSNCSNNFGPFQHPEKLIPLVIAKAVAGESIPVYGRGGNVRDWLFVGDHVRALDEILCRGRPGRSYHVGARNELPNIELVERICALLDELRPDPAGPHARLIRFVTDRPGHDLRYAIDPSRLESELGWRPRETFECALRQTVAWYLAHEDWSTSVHTEGYCGQRLGLLGAGAPAG